jgi:hypothetical protein
MSELVTTLLDNLSWFPDSLLIVKVKVITICTSSYSLTSSLATLSLLIPFCISFLAAIKQAHVAVASAPCYLLLPLLGMFLPDIHVIRSLASFKTILKSLSQ